MSGVTLIPSYTDDQIYPSYQDRLLIKSLLGANPGVVGTEDYKVSAGTGLQVNVKSGNCFVAQTGAIEESGNTFYDGMYLASNPTETNPVNSVIVSAENPQIAQIIVRIYDVGELKTSGSSKAQIEWLNGSPTAGATEAKMKEGKFEGAAALPTSSFRFARVLVPKNATVSGEYYIEDARTFAEAVGPKEPEGAFRVTAASKYVFHAELAFATPHTPDATHSTAVSAIVACVSEVGAQIQFVASCGGVTVGEINAIGAGEGKEIGGTMSFICPPSITWQVTVSGVTGAKVLDASYLISK